jgi:hypothetical protein
MIIGRRESGICIDTNIQAARSGIGLQRGAKELFYQTHRKKIDVQNDTKKKEIVNWRKVVQDRDG